MKQPVYKQLFLDQFPDGKHDGLIKCLHEKEHRDIVNFRHTRECRSTLQVGRVRMYRYEWRFLENDFRRVALFQARFAAVQKAAITSAETKRKQLLQQIEGEEEEQRRLQEPKPHHHHHPAGHHHRKNTTGASEKKEAEDGKPAKTERSSEKKRHHHFKK